MDNIDEMKLEKPKFPRKTPKIPTMFTTIYYPLATSRLKRGTTLGTNGRSNPRTPGRLFMKFICQFMNCRPISNLNVNVWESLLK